MFKSRRKIEKWSKGPKGFAAKANQQIEALEQRLPNVPVGRGLLAERAIIIPVDSFWAKITGCRVVSVVITLVTVQLSTYALGEITVV